MGAARGNGRRLLSLLTAALSTVIRLRGCPAQRGDGPCLCSWGRRGPFPGTLGCTDPSSACRSDVGIPGTLTSAPRTLDVDVDVCTHTSLVPQTWLSPALTYLCPYPGPHQPPHLGITATRFLGPEPGVRHQRVPGPLTLHSHQTPAAAPLRPPHLLCSLVSARAPRTPGQRPAPDDTVLPTHRHNHTGSVNTHTRTHTYVLNWRLCELYM